MEARKTRVFVHPSGQHYWASVMSSLYYFNISRVGGILMFYAGRIVKLFPFLPIMKNMQIVLSPGSRTIILDPGSPKERSDLCHQKKQSKQIFLVWSHTFSYSYSPITNIYTCSSHLKDDFMWLPFVVAQGSTYRDVYMMNKKLIPCSHKLYWIRIPLAYIVP